MKMAALALAVLALPLVAPGLAPAGAATVAVSLDCGDFDDNGDTFPVQDLTVAQGDTIVVTWNADCAHPTFDETVLRTDAAVADAYFSAVPGQAAGVNSGSYIAIVGGSSSATWVVRYDAPLGQMPLVGNMAASWPFVCSNCGLGAALRLTITPGPTVPAAPVAITAVAGDGSATVSWTPPVDDGGSPVTSYTATAAPGGATCTVMAPTTSCTIDGLTNGQAVTFSVTATNAVGAGPASVASAAVEPAAPVIPTPPTAVPVSTPVAAPPAAPPSSARDLSFTG
jgi:hypothetical protein